MRKCPLCRRETTWEDNPWRPFCSERCQMIDLGRWAAEEYRMPLAETAEELTLDFEREPGSDEQTQS